MPLFKNKNEDAEVQEDEEKMLKNSKSKGMRAKLNPTKLKNSIKNLADPSKHVEKLKGTVKWVSWVGKKVRSRGAAFPLFMIAVNTLYLVLGGLGFMYIEKTPKVEYSTTKELTDIFDILKNSSIGYTLPNYAAGSEVVQNFSSSDINQFEEVLLEITSVRADASKPQWTLLNSIYFCLTVTTTIGYGNLAPVTPTGRMVCVVYALLGIPLTLALLAVVGKIVGDYINHGCSIFIKWFQRIVPKYQYESSKDHDLGEGEVDAPLWLGLVILVGFTAMTAGLHCWMEGWDFGTAFYFQYVTYLTIGFGDVVPSKERFVFVNIFLTFLGLAVLSVVLSLIASNLSSQMKKARFIEKLKEQELSDVSVASIESDEDEEDKEKSPSRGESSGMAGSDANGGKTYGSTSP